ncbi:HAMP domain-containing sensor histidine kinase [Pedobacter miscanthi]|jgi:signal transduction histidine kinase|uniref:sensor histidine kinase n=1 Tax=Pedobacter miscanthi TaxID=2259170 RepID=UPI002930F7F1|nr:HAMP domain-containing sensor histidine kinase [Pedobacter miscanthi]
MKLLTRTIINYFWLTIGVLLVTGFLLYGFLYLQIFEEIKEQLQLQESMVAKEISEGRKVNFPLVKTEAVPLDRLMVNPVFKDTLIYDDIQKKKEGYYILRQPRQINGQVYMIEVMTTHIGWDGYSRAIIFIFILIAMMIVVVGSIINYFSNRKLLWPFLQNLDRLKVYSVSSNEKLELVGSDISEFKEFNLVINGLTERAGGEYRVLKEFTENASHEIQTPLSIIQGKLDRMSQFDQSVEMTGFIADAKSAVNRLTKVNKGLLLLAKLDNGAFPDENVLDISNLLFRQMEQIDDLIDHKAIKLVTEIKPKKITASASLMEVLISNLLSNMIAHSPKGATAKIVLLKNKISFENSGNQLPFEEHKLFNRFGKSVLGKTGNGLGLPIVQQICLLYGWQISYCYRGGNHIFEIIF